MTINDYEEILRPKKYSFIWRFDIVTQDLIYHRGLDKLCLKPVWTARRLTILVLGLTNIYAEQSITPVVQIYFVIWVNFLHGIYICYSRPFIENQFLKVEQFNTLIFYFLSVFLLFYTKSANFDAEGIYMAPASAFYIDTTFRSLFLIFTVVNLGILLKD